MTNKNPHSTIVTITLNPSIDKSTTVNRLIPEQKMQCESPRFDAGGGGINVSKAIKRLGGNSLAIFSSGGASGELLQQLLKSEAVDFEAIETQQPIRENFMVTETTTNAQYRFGMSGPVLLESEKQQFLDRIQILKPHYVVASGSLPPKTEANFYEKVAVICKKINAKLILDTSGEPLRSACDEGVFLLKPSIVELCALMGVEHLEMDDVDDAAKTLIGKRKCEKVVVSLGPNGALLVTDKLAKYIPAPTIQKKSTVGAGDSMVAGMTWAMAQGKNDVEMVCWGVACGSAATMNEGTQLFQKADAVRLYEWVKKHIK